MSAASRHWDRRRKGICNSAPELRGREAGDDEDELIGGDNLPKHGWAKDGIVSHSRSALKGIVGKPSRREVGW